MPIFGRVGRPGLLGLAARTAVVSGTATAVSGAIASRQHQRAAEMAAPPVPPPVPPAPPVPAAAATPMPTDPQSILTQLATLHAMGVLTDTEFSAASTRLFSAS